MFPRDLRTLNYRAAWARKELEDAREALRGSASDDDPRIRPLVEEATTLRQEYLDRWHSVVGERPVRVYCGRCCTTGRDGRRRPVRETIGMLYADGDKWKGLYPPRPADEWVALAGTDWVEVRRWSRPMTCGRCGLTAVVDAPHAELTRFLRERTQERRRQSLSYLVERGLAHELTDISRLPAPLREHLAELRRRDPQATAPRSVPGAPG
ncbi:hypothetical protein [uncultured Actinomyces sp.]|uniref:hypothetical protein n=1 Tax=uncultured Actinomyces sp. TaxID=249061 RepID=UPI00263201AC|nr:hypothetical protein [uncultured Actinomyces sp.]